MIHYFGYAKEQVGQERNETGYFEYTVDEISRTAANLANHCQFRKDSQRALEYVSSSGFDPSKHYTINTGDCTPALDAEDLANV